MHIVPGDANARSSRRRMVRMRWPSAPSPRPGIHRLSPPRLHGLVMAATLAWLVAFPGVLPPRPAVAAERAAEWHTSYEAAMAEAESRGRPVFVLFTGSDWCPHCRTLEKNVIDTPLFREAIGDRVVLLLVDLPREGISEAVRFERSKVCIQYGVRSFPAVVILGPDGTKLAEKKGYQGQSAQSWVAEMSHHIPADNPPPATAVASSERVAADPTNHDGVLDSLGKAIETARGSKRPILLVVARPGDKAARSHSDSLISDPEFAPFVEENFIVAHVPPTAASGSQEAASMENLLGGVELAPDAVELIVTDDGQTPLFSQSGAQPPARIVHGLRRFLAARQAARFGETSVR